MQLNKIVFFLLSVVIVLEGTAMTASDGFEYYSRFYTNYDFPFGVEKKYRITAEEAEKRKSYTMVKRDEKNKIILFMKIVKGECHFSHLYTYHENGELVSVKEVVCDLRKDVRKHLSCDIINNLIQKKDEKRKNDLYMKFINGEICFHRELMFDEKGKQVSKKEISCDQDQNK
jgi:hypothetical protein